MLPVPFRLNPTALSYPYNIPTLTIGSHSNQPCQKGMHHSYIHPTPQHHPNKSSPQLLPKTHHHHRPLNNNTNTINHHIKSSRSLTHSFTHHPPHPHPSPLSPSPSPSSSPTTISSRVSFQNAAPQSQHPARPRRAFLAF